MRRLFESETEARAFSGDPARKAAAATPPPDPIEPLTLAIYAERKFREWRRDLAHRTMATYQQRWANHVGPALGAMPLADIRRRDIQALLDARGRDGLARDSVRLIRATVSVLLSAAVDDELLQSNPCRELSRRAARRGQRRVEKRVRVMTREQREAFLQAAEPARLYHALWETMFRTGTRPSEALALRVTDIDFTAATLQVERALDDDGTMKPTKTETARVVDLSDGAVARLRRHLLALRTNALKRGWGEPVWLFPDERGRPLNASRMRWAFAQALKRAGLPTFSPYDCRHTYASAMLAASAPLAYVAAQLGHANPGVTLKFYAHHIPDRGRRWANLVDGFGSVLPPEAATTGRERWDKGWA